MAKEKIENFTQEAVVNYIKNTDFGSKTFNLKGDQSIYVDIDKVKNKKAYFFAIYLDDKFSKELVKQGINFKKSAPQKGKILVQYLHPNYGKVTKRVYDLCKSLGVLPRKAKGEELEELKKGINIYTKSKKLDLGENIEPKEEGLKQLELPFGTISKKVEKYTMRDFNNFIKNEQVTKIKCTPTNMTIHCSSGEKLTTYSRGDIIRIMVAYVQELIQQKKDRVYTINHKIRLVSYTDKDTMREFNIIESKDGTEIEDNGFVDKNLSNVFALCSLEDLGVDEKKLKMWLNKIITRDNIKLVTFSLI